MLGARRDMTGIEKLKLPFTRQRLRFAPSCVWLPISPRQLPATSSNPSG
jgi:hypothetical protein